MIEGSELIILKDLNDLLERQYQNNTQRTRIQIT